MQIRQYLRDICAIETAVTNWSEVILDVPIYMSHEKEVSVVTTDSAVLPVPPCRWVLIWYEVTLDITINGTSLSLCDVNSFVFEYVRENDDTRFRTSFPYIDDVKLNPSEAYHTQILQKCKITSMNLF